LQDAYAAETNAVGKWDNIGYIAPGGNTFTYTGGDVAPSTTCATGTWNETKNQCWVPATTDGEGKAVAEHAGTPSGSSITKGWVASNNAKLNDCDPAAHWDISSAIGLAASNKGSVAYTKSELSAVCAQLTPNYTAIGQ